MPRQSVLNDKKIPQGFDCIQGATPTRKALIMILGTGIDIVEVGRIESSYQRFGERFLNRLLLPEEIRYCMAHRVPGPYLAARFAAKEAVAKAFGTGIGRELGWLDMEVFRKASGEPCLALHGKALGLMAARRALRVHLTLSHAQHYATAMAIIEG